MQSEIYYVIGKPACLKHEFFNRLWQASQDVEFIKIPRLFTTNPALMDLDNIFHIDERDFELRDSMGIYCLSWKKADHFYGICGEGAQWAQNGYSVVINGSLHNLEQALKVFPEINVVMLRMESVDELATSNLLIEADDAHLEWVPSLNGISCPYVLNLLDQGATTTASQLLVELLEYNRRSVLEKAG